MASPQTGVKPLPEPMLTQFTDKYVPLREDELKNMSEYITWIGKVMMYILIILTL